MGFLYNIGLRLMNLIVFFLIVILLPGLPPRTTFPFKEFQVTPPKELKGALEPNFHLEGAEHLLDGRVYGPESLIARKNEIYTGIHGGEVIKITSQHVTHVAKVGQPCEDIFEEARCGRPLGLAFDTKGNNLIIADAYYGIWEADLTSHKKKLLISPHQELPGKNVNRKAKVFNGVAVDLNGDIYWTDSSSDFTIQDLVFTSFANPSGRLFKYDRAQNVSKVLLDELYFANGVVLSPDEKFVVVAETGANRLLRYYINGPDTGYSDVFVDGLPGLPDNLTPDAEGLWVPLVMSADDEHPSAYAIFSQFPSLRLFLARLLSLIELPFQIINNAYPNKIAQRFIHFIGHGESITLLAPKRSTIVRLDWDGNILGSLHGFDKSVGAVSHVLEFNDYLLLGSPFNRYLARVKSPKSSQQQIKIKNVKMDGVEVEPVIQKQTTSSTTTTEKTTSKPSTKQQTTTTTTKTTTATTTTTTTTSPTSTSKTTTTTRHTTARTTTPTPKSSTTTSKPITTTKAPTTQKSTEKTHDTTTPIITTTVAPSDPKTLKEPAPVKEDLIRDTPPPKKEKLKIINKHGENKEL